MRMFLSAVRTWWLLPVLVLALGACQKEVNLSSGEQAVQPQKLLAAGVIPDNPELVARVPVIVSSDFLKQSSKDPLSIQQLAKRSTTTTDKTAPSISITTPANGSTVAGTVQVTVNASDNVGVASVTLAVNGSTVGSSTTAPFTNTWNSATIANGQYTLTVTARDRAGNAKAASIQVTVNNVTAADITSPTVSITSPANGASVTGTVSIAAQASDNVGINVVQFSLNGTLLSSDNSAPYAVDWNTAGLTSGLHTLSARAWDAAGNSSTHTIQVSVNTNVIDPATLPSRYELATPVPANQGNEGACVAFAVAYGARSIEQYYRTNAGSYSYTSNVFSPEYVYNQTKFGDCGSGTAFTTVLDLMKAQGVATWQAMPYSDVNGCSLMPDATQTANAANFKISGYATIPNTDRTAIKAMIASKHPVIVNVIADNSFVNAGPGFIWKAYSGSGALPHAIIIVGYDDAKNAYKIMNSFGTGWGDGGFAWIDYDFFPQKSSYNTYVIQ